MVQKNKRNVTVDFETDPAIVEYIIQYFFLHARRDGYDINKPAIIEGIYDTSGVLMRWFGLSWGGLTRPTEEEVSLERKVNYFNGDKQQLQYKILQAFINKQYKKDPRRAAYGRQSAVDDFNTGQQKCFLTLFFPNQAS